MGVRWIPLLAFSHCLLVNAAPKGDAQQYGGPGYNPGYTNTNYQMTLENLRQMGKYGSLSEQTAGNVREMPPNSRMAVQRNYQQSFYSAPTGMMPVNPQGQMFTRSYTPLNNNCYQVCRARPPINMRPTCRPACNITPVCSNQAQSPVYGSTSYCRPQSCGTSSCQSGWGGSGYNPGSNTVYNPSGNSGYNPGNNDIVNGGSGYNPGDHTAVELIDANEGYNPGQQDTAVVLPQPIDMSGGSVGGCGSLGCGGGGIQPNIDMSGSVGGCGSLGCGGGGIQPQAMPMYNYNQMPQQYSMPMPMQQPYYNQQPSYQTYPMPSYQMQPKQQWTRPWGNGNIMMPGQNGGGLPPMAGGNMPVATSGCGSGGCGGAAPAGGQQIPMAQTRPAEDQSVVPPDEEVSSDDN